MPQTLRRAHLLSVMVCLWLGLLSLASASERRLLVMGDSLSAAFGMAAEQGWVALLQQRLQPLGWQVVNASISGETTAGGATRIDTELQRHQPDLVLIELGANDALRGLPLDLARGNLQRMIEASRRSGAKVLLVGMQIPPNYGPDYTQQFIDLFADLAQQQAIALLPFLLEPIADDPAAFQPDQLHPLPDRQAQLLDHVWPALQPLLSAPVAQ